MGLGSALLVSLFVWAVATEADKDIGQPGDQPGGQASPQAGPQAAVSTTPALIGALPYGKFVS